MPALYRTFLSYTVSTKLTMEGDYIDEEVKISPYSTALQLVSFD